MKRIRFGLVLLGCAVAGLSQTPNLSWAQLQPIRTLQLEGPTNHVQGIDFDEDRIWVTSVDSALQKGYLRVYSARTGQLEQTAELQDGARFHPGGIMLDGASVWIPVAEYRPNSTSVIQRRNSRTLKLESSFKVSDHIGCIAFTETELIGGNWDSRDFYVWDRNGKLMRKTPSATGNAYQDMKFDAGSIVASGVFKDRTGAIDWLEPKTFRLLRRLPAVSTESGALFTREGMAFRSGQLAMLPEDDSSRVYFFRIEP